MKIWSWSASVWWVVYDNSYQDTCHISDWYSLLPRIGILVPYLYIKSLNLIRDQAPVSISDKTSNRKILQSLEAARFVFRIVQSLWNLTGTSAAACACQISKRWDDLNYQSRGFETSRDLAIRRLFGYWNGALEPVEFHRIFKGVAHYMAESLEYQDRIPSNHPKETRLITVFPNGFHSTSANWQM